MDWMGMPGALAALRKADVGESWMAVVRWRRGVYEATILKGIHQLAEASFDDEEAGKAWCEATLDELIPVTIVLKDHDRDRRGHRERVSIRSKAG